jgi:hypothetical protein
MQSFDGERAHELGDIRRPPGWSHGFPNFDNFLADANDTGWTPPVSEGKRAEGPEFFRALDIWMRRVGRFLGRPTDAIARQAAWACSDRLRSSVLGEAA